MATVEELERRILDLEAQARQGLELSQHHAVEHYGEGRDPASSWVTHVPTSADVPATSVVARLYEVVTPLQLWISDPEGKRQVGGTLLVATLHNLLSATHPDTLAGGVTRGEIIVGNATPRWARVLPGQAGTYIRFNGVDTIFSGIRMNDVLGQHVYLGDSRLESQGEIVSGNTKLVYGPLELLVDVLAKSMWIATVVGAGSSSAKAVIYADSAGVPGALVATSNEVIISNTAISWNEFVFATPPMLNAQSKYWLGIHVGSTPLAVRLSSITFGPTVALALYSSADTYSDGPSNPFGVPGLDLGRVMSCYVEGLQYTDAMARAAVPYQVVIPMLIEPVVF